LLRRVWQSKKCARHPLISLLVAPFAILIITYLSYCDGRAGTAVRGWNLLTPPKATTTTKPAPLATGRLQEALAIAEKQAMLDGAVVVAFPDYRDRNRTLAPWRNVALASQFSPSHVWRLPPTSHLPRASGEAADVALPSRRPRQHRWAQMRPRVGGGVDLAVFGGRPGEGGQRAGLPGPRRGGEWAGSPPPSPAFASISFCYATRTLSVPATPQTPSPPCPELQTRHFGAARKTRVAGPRRGRIPDREEIANPESWSSPAPAEMAGGGRKSLVPMLRGQRRRCPIKANGSGVNHP
jgi:hypothetical protein